MHAQARIMQLVLPFICDVSLTAYLNVAWAVPGAGNQLETRSVKVECLAARVKADF